MKKVILFLFIVMTTANALVVGIDPAREPFAYYDEKHNLIGFDIDFFAEVEKELGEPIEILHMPFSGLLPALESGKIDMLGTSITVTPEREKKVVFTKQIYKPKLSFVGKMDSKDLTKKKVGVVIGTPNADILKKLNYENVIYFDSADMLYVSLEEGKVDYIFHNNITNKNYVKKHNMFKIVGKNVSIGSSNYPVAKNNTELLKKLNNIITKLEKSGFMKKLNEKWL